MCAMDVGWLSRVKQEDGGSNAMESVKVDNGP
jgi:hypothetical protein